MIYSHSMFWRALILVLIASVLLVIPAANGALFDSSGSNGLDLKSSGTHRLQNAPQSKVARNESLVPSATSIYATTSTVQVSNSTHLVLNKPSGIAPGDLLLIFLSERSSTVQNPPPGFIQERLIQVGSLYFSAYCFYKIADGTEASAITFDQTTTSRSAVGAYYVIQYADQVNPFEDDQAAITTSSSTSVTIPSVSPTDAPTLEIAIAGGYLNTLSNFSFTPPDSWSEDIDLSSAIYSSSSTGMEGVSINRNSGGATGTSISTASHLIDSGRFGMALSIRPALDQIPVARYIPTVSADGQVLTATGAVWSELPEGNTSWQWQRDSDGNGVFSDITGATNSTYTLATADFGNRVRAKAIRTNNAGVGIAYSKPVNTPADAPVAFVRAVTSASQITNSTHLILDKPVGVASGDLLLVFFSERSTRAQNPPPGFIQKDMMLFWNDVRTYCFYKIADGTEASVVTFDQTSNSAPAVGVYYDVQYANQTNPFEDYRKILTNFANSTNVLIPSITPNDSPSLEITAVGGYINTLREANFTPPLGWTEDVDIYSLNGASSSADIETLSRGLNSSSNTAAAISLASSSLDSSYSMAFSIRPALSQTPIIRFNPTLSVSGAPGIGQVLTANDGTWSELPTGTTSWQWQRDSGGDGNFVDIAGANGATYTVAADDGGDRVRAKAIRVNNVGTGVAYTKPRNIITNLPAVRAVTSATQTNASTHLALNKPSAVVPGDLLLIFFSERSNTAQNPPAGFTQKDMVSVTGFNTYCFYKIADGTEASSVTFDQTNTSRPAVGVYYDIQSADRTYPFEDYQALTDNNNSTTAPVPLVNPQDAPTLEIAALGNYYGSLRTISSTPPTGWTENADVSSLNGASSEAGLEAISIYRNGSDPTSSEASTNSYAPSSHYGIALLIRPTLSQIPALYSPPTISGEPQDGQTLIVDPGIWNNGATSYYYQWQRCDSNGINCVNISGADAAIYIVRSDDVGSTLRVVVQANNPSGSISVFSNLTTVVQGIAPTIVSSPTITGRDEIGQSLTASSGTWGGSTPINYSYQWQTSTDGGNTWANENEPDATTNAHVVVSEDVGSILRIIVAATNPGGSTFAYSVFTQIILNQEYLQALAFKYRPALLFDTSEFYRPITINSLLSETLPNSNTSAHRRCYLYFASIEDEINNAPSEDCTSINSLDTGQTGLLQPTEFPIISDPAGGPWLSIYHNGSGAEGYYSPNCGDDFIPTANLRDCLASSEFSGVDIPGIYYDFGQNELGYRFLDYWFFYRYNSMNNNDHEGDWEGVTVVLSPNSGLNGNEAVAGVIFWQHGVGSYKNAASLQWCSEGADNYNNCVGNYPSEEATHVADFVARGSHASYDSYCSGGSCVNPANFHLQPEGDHDGGAGWLPINSDEECMSYASNSDNSCVHPMMYIDGSATPGWVTWLGKWGGSYREGLLGIATSPGSPGNQRPYQCTQAGWTISDSCDPSLNNTNINQLPSANITNLFSREHSSVVNHPTKKVISSAFEKSPPHSGHFMLEYCETWYDLGLAAFACSPSQLQKAVVNGKLRAHGSFSLTIRGYRTGASPGLVQIDGGPLKIGAVISPHGTPVHDEMIIINCLVGNRVYAIEMSNIKISRASKIRLVLRSSKPTVSLSGLSAKVKTTLVRTMK